MSSDISGSIIPVKGLTGELSPVGGLSGTLSYGLPPYVPYEGSYEVTPLPEAEVVLETAGKKLEDDVTVLAIPYFETTNESGGYTVIIG